MESAQLFAEITQEQEMLQTKKRLEAFQFRRTTPITTQMMPSSPTHNFGRSHSRNGSRTSSTLTTSQSAPPELSSGSSGSRPSSLTTRSRPSSHHRRRSSVSTRVESAEIMGLALPDLPSSTSDDNINFGDKDSIRRRALMALEGKNDFSSKNGLVEIPDLTSQGIPTKPFDSKSSSLAPSLGALPGKRDSFGKYLSSATNSLKDQLHTLMEEEEEEEEEYENANSSDDNAEVTLIGANPRGDSLSSSRDSFQPSINISKHSVTATPHPASPPTRHKPAHLTLRPLALATSTSNNLPTPGTTPSARSGLRTLTLGSASSDCTAFTPEPRSWSNFSRSPSESLDLSTYEATNASAHMGCVPSRSPVPQKRQSSISYIRSDKAPSPPQLFTGLPTPGPTPTLERRQSLSSNVSMTVDRERRNVSEDSFMLQSHAALLSRIRELEQLLRTRSRPASLYSDESIVPTENNELLQLIADLKADRDGLKKNLSETKVCLDDMSNQSIKLQENLDTERREASMKAEKISILESEKITLQRQIRLKDQELTSLTKELRTKQGRLDDVMNLLATSQQETNAANALIIELQAQLAEKKINEAEFTRVREELAAERTHRIQLVAQLEGHGLPRTRATNDSIDPKSVGSMKFTVPIRGNTANFQSIDSTADSIRTLSAPFTLKVVKEENTNAVLNFSDEDDGLAHYEDEDEDDLGMLSPSQTVSSYSDEEIPHRSNIETSVSFRNEAPPSSRSFSPSPFSSPCPTPLPPLPLDGQAKQHTKNASLSKGWTFPRDRPTASTRQQEEVDHFFGCLDDLEDSPRELNNGVDGNLFRQHLRFTSSEDEMPPFILPSNDLAPDNSRLLDVVLEADEIDCPLNETSTDESFDSRLGKKEHHTFPTFLHKSPTQKPVNGSSPATSYTKSSPRNGSAISGHSLIPKSVTRLYQPSTPERAYVKSLSNSQSTSIHTSPAMHKQPSAPTFIQAKPSQLNYSPNALKRKPAPIAPAQSVIDSSAHYEPARSTAQSRNGSTFIPKLKSPNANSPSCSSSFRSSVQDARIVDGLTLASHPARSDPHDLSTSSSNSVTPNTSPQPMLQTISNFFPIPKMSWMSSKQTKVKKTRGLVSREVQLAKLRKQMSQSQSFISSTSCAQRCVRCQGDIIKV